MKAIRMICVTLGVVAGIVLMGSAADAKSRNMGTKTSTITSYQTDTGIHCHGRCFATGQTHDWTCPAGNGNATPVCHLNCNARPPTPVEDCLFQ